MKVQNRIQILHKNVLQMMSSEYLQRKLIQIPTLPFFFREASSASSSPSSISLRARSLFTLGRFCLGHNTLPIWLHTQETGNMIQSASQIFTGIIINANTCCKNAFICFKQVTLQQVADFLCFLQRVFCKNVFMKSNNLKRVICFETFEMCDRMWRNCIQALNRGFTAIRANFCTFYPMKRWEGTDVAQCERLWKMYKKDNSMCFKCWSEETRSAWFSPLSKQSIDRMLLMDRGFSSSALQTR